MALFVERFPSSDNLMLGAGSLYFDRLDDNGKFTGERHLGNCTAFTLTTEAETIKKYSCMTGDKRLIKSIVKQVGANGKITLDYFDKENLALALLGDVKKLNQTSGNATDEVATAYKGRYVRLAHRKVSTLVVTDSAGLVTYVEGTDYEATASDLEMGRIYIIETGAIADAAEIKVDYAYAVIDQPMVTGGTSSKIEGYLRFVGDPTTGPVYEGEFWRVSVTPEGDIGFISDDWASFGLTIECMDQSSTHPKDPFYRLLDHGVK